MKYYLSQLAQGSELNLMKASLLQKLIRRGMVEEALYIGDMYIKANQSKGLKRRLQIICAEDLGFGWLGSVKFLNENENNLLLVIENMCLAPKNRESDIFLLSVAAKDRAMLNLKDSQVNYEVRVLSRLFELSSVWFNDKSKENLSNLKNAFSKMSENHKYGEIISILGDNYVELTKQKVHGARCQMALAALIYARKWDKDEVFSPRLESQSKPREFDEIFDFAIDMHTPIGKKLKLDFEHWVNNCVLVIPEIKYPELLDSQGIPKYQLTKNLK